MKLLTVLILFMSLFSLAEEPLQYWKKRVSQFKGLNLEEQAFCFTDNGEVKGHNIDKPLRVASVAKIFPALILATRSVFGINHRFTTSVYIDGENIHIDGGNNPGYTPRVHFKLIDKLSSLRKKNINITFENLDFSDDEYDSPYSALVYNEGSKTYCVPHSYREQTTIEKLYLYSQTQEWKKTYVKYPDSANCNANNLYKSSKIAPKSIATYYQEMKRKFGYQSVNPQVYVKDIKFQKKVNPKGQKYIIQSATLEELLQVGLTYSVNKTFDKLYELAGGKKFFSKELSNVLNYPIIAPESGSGLTYKIFEKGKENILKFSMATCRSVITVKHLLAKYLLNESVPLFNPKSDFFETKNSKLINRLFPRIGGPGTLYSYKTNQSIAGDGKTGTLNNAKGVTFSIETNTGSIEHMAMIHNFDYANSHLKHTANIIMKDTLHKSIANYFDLKENLDETFSVSKLEDFDPSIGNFQKADL